ncbi:hypothetical protein K7X08_026235 [Anisodus acutangulus]|uniref:FHA domain-containing protein n=1 Tax=Anisodus acutangulus TaxID=402998 RepID=A0A9Q1RS70_9SOLA|nr:hypothetical protein K7X08_026235 [Anisodus acutangulus]
MELTTTSESLSCANLPKLQSIFPSRATLCSSNSINFLGYNCVSRKLKYSARQLRHFGAIHASVAESNSTNGSVTWVLEFIVTVGRVADKADVVIPRCLQNMEEYLVVTDLDSTNGTFIGEKRLTPGVAAAALPGSVVTFGNTNLAIFRVAKLEKLETTASEPEEAEANSKEEEPNST